MAKLNAISDFNIVNSEKRKTLISAINQEDPTKKIYNWFSSCKKQLRIIAWIYRFFTNCTVEHATWISGILTLEEIKLINLYKKKAWKE